MMKKLYTFIVKSFLGPFVVMFFISLFVLVMQFLWKYVDDLVGKGLEWYVLAELLFYAASTFVPLALPLAVLLASLMTFGNLSEYSELTAMKASGVSLTKAMRPMFFVVGLIAVAGFLFSNYVLPVANLKMGSLLYDVREQKPALNIKEGIFNSEIDGYVIWVRKKEKDGQTLRDVKILDHTNRNGRFNFTIAKSGKMHLTEDKRYMVFKLFDGHNYIEPFTSRNDKDKYPFRRSSFDKQQVLFDLSDFSLSRSNEEIFKDNYQMMNITQLKIQIDSLKNDFEKQAGVLARRLSDRCGWFRQYYDKDSLIMANAVPMQIDSPFIKNIPADNRHAIYENAMSNLRGDVDYLSFAILDRATRKRILFRHAIEYQRKFTLSFACFVLFLIGAPLGAIIRKGGFGMPLVLSVILFIIFHVLSMTGEKMVREGSLPAEQGMWIAAFVLFPFGVLLTIKATGDVAILSFSFYLEKIKKIISLFRNRNPYSENTPAV